MPMHWLRAAALGLVAVVGTEGQALAQAAPERGGFTILVNLGAGVQQDTFLEQSAVGLAGLNLGVGGFLTEDLALLFRISGTGAAYEGGSRFLRRTFPGLFTADFKQYSGVGGPTLQYWVSDRFNVEAGGGLGFWMDPARNSGSAFGLILGTGMTIANRGRHNLQVGVEYAPAFTDPGTVHNIGFTVGYQFL